VSLTDLNTPDMTALFAAAPLYRKSAIVAARRASAGERIVTVMSSGHVETSVTCDGGEWVITNPGGELYVISAEKFARRYEPADDGRYRAKGIIRAFRNPAGVPVTILAPWGEDQVQDGDCMFATEFFPGDPGRIGSDRYLIGAAEFAETYVAHGHGGEA
jgi:PGDYG protein